MFNINGFELLIICLAAFLLLGPKNLAATARKLGQFYSKLAKYAEDFKLALDNVVEPLSEVSSQLSSNRRMFIQQIKAQRDETISNVFTSLPLDNKPTVSLEDFLHPEYQTQKSYLDFLGDQHDDKS